MWCRQGKRRGSEIFDHDVDLVGNRGDGEMRIAEFGKYRRRCQVKSGAVGRHDEIGFVLVRHVVDRLDVFARIGAVIIFEQLHLRLLALGGKAAAGVNLFFLPKPVGRPVGHRGGGEPACFRADDADLGFVGLRRA